MPRKAGVEEGMAWGRARDKAWGGPDRASPSRDEGSRSPADASGCSGDADLVSSCLTPGPVSRSPLDPVHYHTARLSQNWLRKRDTFRGQNREGRGLP